MDGVGAVDEGLQREKKRGGGQQGGTTCRTHTPAAGWFQKQDGNIRLEEIAN